jgi:Tfp pilus assembly protein PilP
MGNPRSNEQGNGMSKRTPRMLARTLLAAALIAGAGLGSGCEFLGLDEGEVEQQEDTTEEDEPKQEPPTEQPTEPAQKKASEDDEYQRPEYPNMARRNPFQPDVEVVKPAKPVEGEDRTLEPLEQFALGELELVAIISEVAVPKAMFVDPDGFGHVLKEGDRIGRNSGVLSDIRDNEVEITETTGDDGGQTRLRKVKLREVELSAGDDASLSEEERQALEKLLETEEGRKALERQYRDMALGASAVDEEGSEQNTTETSRKNFPGIRPPSKNR